MSSVERRYGAHELREILKRAESREPAAAEAQGLTRSELLEIGREVGVSEEQMTTALARYDSEQELAVAESEVQQLQRRGFVTHLIAFFWVGAALGLLSLWAGPPILIPMLLWALGLTLHVRAAFFPDPDALRHAARKRLVRHIAGFRRLARFSPYVAGETFTTADCAATSTSSHAANDATQATARARYVQHLDKERSLVAAAKWLSAEKLEHEEFHPQIQRALEHAVKPLTRYRCAACGFEARQHFWQCPGCQTWDSYPARRVEEL